MKRGYDKNKSYAMNALSFLPSFKFATQDSGEIVHLVVRAHPATQLGWFVGIIIFSAIPIMFGRIIANTPATTSQVLFFIISWYAVLLSVAITEFFIWYFNIGIITSNKLIDVDTHGILYNESASAFITQVEELRDTSKGIWSAVFNFGDIYVQTAGEEQNIEFKNVPKPALVVQIINNLIKKSRAKRT